MFTIGLLTAVFLVVFALLAGMVLTLIIQWYFFNRYLLKLPLASQSEEVIAEQFQIPQSLLEGDFKPEPAKALNSVLQFLFQECRNTKRVRRWFRTRLSIELEELLTRTTTGKLFEAIALRELHLGTQFPNIIDIEVKKFNVSPSCGLIDDLELCLQLEYCGGFQLTIDANMRLNKTARVSVKVNQLKGLGCLRFTRHPYTHWSFSFYSDPQLQLTVESQFQGRTLPQINSIIASQIRKALKRKHTLPNFKLRYKPFFHKSDPGVVADEGSSEMAVTGSLDVSVLQVSRISDTPGPVYCSLAVDSMAWVEMVHSDSGSYLTVDVSVLKQAGSLGVHFKQEFVADKYQVCFVVESVAPYVVAEVRAGDILVAVDGKKAVSLPQISKVIKQAGDRVGLRLERRLKILTTTPPPDDKTLEISGLRHRRGSGDKTDSDSSNSASLSDSPAKKTLKESPDHKVIHRMSFGCETEQQQLQVLTTRDQPYAQVITFSETLKFNILPEHKFLNLSVWSRSPSGGSCDKNSLLGHVSLPLSTLCVSTLGHHVDTHSLLPPYPHLLNSSTHPLSSHNGFEPCLCYGDVLLSTSFTASHVPPTSVPTLLVPPSPSPALVSNSHDFERTHFNRATQCGFCFKKIWLKDAFQCKGCAMTCHKKCVVKCLAVSSCGRRASAQPEIVTTSADDNDTKPEQVRRLSSLLASVTNKGLKRVSSASNLAPPSPCGGSGGCGGSVSLPPSPQHSPSPSRKTSLGEGGTLFTLEGEDGDEITTALAQLLARPQDEELMDQAKATGRQLFADMAPEARKKKIDIVMAKLKAMIDDESQNHLRLTKEEQSSSTTEAKAKAAFLLGKSEEKLHALTVLMLHCCAGLQDSHDTLTLPNCN
ncbi:PDZ domain-containing protein 8 [Macrosteles quadrilineatus]|uniref:PDZ domain-containing protein 8 n=1 Tax=Macrosteles quadrilineatus TaxID=74068 RepID=UPI0023E2769F|nr:PDZ domain-containing protein 8 [Macrosteles quadrilineatus]